MYLFVIYFKLVQTINCQDAEERCVGVPEISAFTSGRAGMIGFPAD